MADNVLEIGALVDVSVLQSGMNQAAAAVASGTAKMAEGFQAAAASSKVLDSAAASLAARLMATGVSAVDAAGGLRNSGFSAQETAAAFASLGVAVDSETFVENENTAAVIRGVSARQAATSAIGELEGRTLSANRAAATFLSTTLGLGPALQAAFPVLGAIALVDVLYQIVKAATDAADAMVGWGKDAQKAYEDMLSSNQKLYVQTLALNEAHRMLGEIGTTGLVKLQRQTEADTASLKEYGAATAAALADIERFKKQKEDLEAARLKPQSSELLGPMGVPAAIQSWIQIGKQIDLADESI
jgi:hypothetical protein